MGRRSLIVFGILLCVFLSGCSKRSQETSDILITQNYDMNIDEEEAFIEDVDMAENKTLQEDNNLAVDEDKKEYNNIEINDTYQDEDTLEAPFYIEELSQEIIERISGKSYKEGADIPYSDLRYIRLFHIGFDGLTHEGEMIVNKAIADDAIEIFKELYEMEYPIEKILLIDDYDADDLISMADNNSSAFNYRLVEGTSRRSVHSDGLAIDINPLYNPYIRSRDGELEVLPENAIEYVDRDKENEYFIRKDDPCYKAFVSRGFTWGGEWNNSKDYQHFEKRLAD